MDKAGLATAPAPGEHPAGGSRGCPAPGRILGSGETATFPGAGGGQAWPPKGPPLLPQAGPAGRQRKDPCQAGLDHPPWTPAPAWAPASMPLAAMATGACAGLGARATPMRWCELAQAGRGGLPASAGPGPWKLGRGPGRSSGPQAEGPAGHSFWAGPGAPAAPARRPPPSPSPIPGPAPPDTWVRPARHCAPGFLAHSPSASAPAPLRPGVLGPGPGPAPGPPWRAARPRPCIVPAAAGLPHDFFMALTAQVRLHVAGGGPVGWFTEGACGGLG